MQKKFWYRMTDLKFQLLYLNEYIDESFKFDNYINIFTAVLQIITAVKSYLPYSRRIKTLSQLQSELADLFNEYDYLWFKVSNGDMTEEEINDKLKTLKIKDTKICNKYLLNNHLPYKKKLSDIAQIKFEQYFDNY